MVSSQIVDQSCTVTHFVPYATVTHATTATTTATAATTTTTTATTTSGYKR